MIPNLDELLKESPPCIPDDLRAELTTLMSKVSKHGVVMVGFCFRPEPLAIEHYMNTPLTKPEFVRTVLDLLRVVSDMENHTEKIESPNLIVPAEA